MDKLSLSRHLNPAQLEAASHTNGPLLILAGAGSGKTRVLTYRIAHLIGSEKVDPKRILGITFTNKAAGELRQRVRDLLTENNISSSSAGTPWLGTFHALGCFILRQSLQQLAPYKSDFSIYDRSQQKTVVRAVLKELSIDPQNLKPNTVITYISNYKNQFVSVEAALARAEGDFYLQRVAQAYKLYQKSLLEQNALDFDDLLLLTLRLFQEKPQVLAMYQARWDYLLIDEYQDTNSIQYQLVHLLSARHKNLCVVGDDDQSIYGWRGAEIRNILDFEKDYPQTKVVVLEQNYRSTQNILDAANQVVAVNKERKQKKLWSALEKGEKILCYLAADELGEARYISRQVKKLHSKTKYKYQQIAVLYRTNAQSRALEDALRRDAIPYIIVGGLKFYDRKEVKDIIAYLRVLYNPLDNVSLQRIINMPPRGFGKMSLDTIDKYSKEHLIGWYDAVKKIVSEKKEKTSLLRRLSAFISLIDGLRKAMDAVPLPDLVEEVIARTGYMEHLQSEPFQLESRRENITELISAAAEFVETRTDAGLSAFLEQVSLVSEADMYANHGAVSLMTVHSAKGLEFPVVFMCGLEEKIFPHQLSIGGEAEIEEERRLCYVGMTRAMERLFLTHVARRRLYGKVLQSPPSRFLDEIPESCMEKQMCPSLESSVEIYDQRNGSGWLSKTSLMPPVSLSQPKTTGLSLVGAKEAYRVGMPVRHPKWGDGKICGMEGSGDKLKLIVDFWGNKKKLLARIAGLQGLK